MYACFRYNTFTGKQVVHHHLKQYRTPSPPPLLHLNLDYIFPSYRCVSVKANLKQVKCTIRSVLYIYVYVN